MALLKVGQVNILIIFNLACLKSRDSYRTIYLPILSFYICGFEGLEYNNYIVVYGSFSMKKTWRIEMGRLITKSKQLTSQANKGVARCR